MHSAVLIKGTCNSAYLGWYAGRQRNHKTGKHIELHVHVGSVYLHVNDCALH